MVFFPHFDMTLLMKKSLTTIKNMKKIVSKWFSLCFFALCESAGESTDASAFVSAGDLRGGAGSGLRSGVESLMLCWAQLIL